MRRLVQLVEELKKSPARKLVAQRMREFARAGKGNSAGLFSELCFCILTANFNAEKSIRIQQQLGGGFCAIPKTSLAKKLKLLGHRHPNVRAAYIADARRQRKKLAATIKNCISKKKGASGKTHCDEKRLREWLVKNVKGIGCKEASHFLRNIGFKNLAIIDFHILDLLARHGAIKKPKTLTRKKYLEIENLLEKIAKRAGMSLAELDLYLWYAETGKVLK